MVLQVKLIALFKGTEHANHLKVVENNNLILYLLMQRLFKPNSSVLALFMFLPITPSIAAITVFTQSVLNDRSTEVTSISHHEQRVIDATRY